LNLFITGSCRGLCANRPSSSFGSRQRTGETAAQGGGFGDLETYGLGWKARDADEREGIAQEDSPAAETNGRH
jgi:hypothetical protein